MKVGVIGAGPGGLATAMLLAHRGFEVEILEKENKVGGRNAAIEKKGYTFDIGPTFFMMPFILEGIFAETGRDLHDYVELKALDPYYQLVYTDGKKLKPGPDPEKVKKSIAEFNPDDMDGYDEYMRDNRKKMQRTLPALQRPYHKFYHLLSSEVLNLLPVLRPWESLWDNLGNYFSNDRVKVGFTFQSKYLGMSPYNCPSLFSILPYTEYEWGVYHVMGGLNKLAEAMAEVFQELGGQIFLEKEVEEIDVVNGSARGLRMKDGEYRQYDEIVMNADFAWGMKNLIPDRKRRKYTDQKLAKKRYSCSTFMLYLGVDKVYDHLLHNNVFIAEDYKKNFMEIEDKKVLSKDPSFYLQNPSVTDSSLAPEGHSTLYVLVPVANLKSEIDWKKEAGSFRQTVIEMLKKRAGMEDIEEHIKYEKMITPLDWQKNLNVGFGATFNLGHNLTQMLYFRPRNKFEEIDNMWIAGGGTTPGSGLPTIYESGRITANVMSDKHNINFEADYEEEEEYSLGE
ncbi:MAG: phytoene desaturase family protein [bacterium]